MFYTLAGILVLNFPREFPDLISLGRSSVPLYVLLLLLIFIFVYIKLGKGPATKSDEFLEKFQTAFSPPPLIFEK